MESTRVLFDPSWLNNRVPESLVTYLEVDNEAKCNWYTIPSSHTANQSLFLSTGVWGVVHVNALQFPFRRLVEDHF